MVALVGGEARFLLAVACFADLEVASQTLQRLRHSTKLCEVTNALMAAGTASRISEAAREILIRDGVEAVTMRRVGDAVGLTSMAIYRHYRNRAELLDKVAEECFAELALRWSRNQWAGDHDAAWVALVDEHLDFALGEPRLYAFLFTGQRPGARRYPEDFHDRASPTLNLLVDGLMEGIRRGVLVEHDVWELALAMAAQLHGLVQLYHGGRIALGEDEFRSLCQRAVGRILDGLRP